MGIPVDLTKSFPFHPTEEILEEYVFERLPEPLVAQVEEHLLICHSCQDAVVEIDRFVPAFKIAARPPVPVAGSPLIGWRTLPRKMTLAPVILLAILAFLAIRKDAHQVTAPVAVSLSSVRGLEPLAPAPAGKPLELDIETPDLRSGSQYTIEVVDASGSPVWNGAVTETGGKLAAHMPKTLGVGVYWVRLYAADSQLLREFGLSAK